MELLPSYQPTPSAVFKDIHEVTYFRLLTWEFLNATQRSRAHVYVIKSFESYNIAIEFSTGVKTINHLWNSNTTETFLQVVSVVLVFWAYCLFYIIVLYIAHQTSRMHPCCIKASSAKSIFSGSCLSTETGF